VAVGRLFPNELPGRHWRKALTASYGRDTQAAFTEWFFGETILTSTPSGAIAFAGSLTSSFFDPNLRSAPSGKIAFAGSRTTEWRLTYAPVGTIAFSGSIVSSYFGPTTFSSAPAGAIAFAGTIDASLEQSEVDPTGVSISFDNGPFDTPSWTALDA
jgi:hypothetical protein